MIAFHLGDLHLGKKVHEFLMIDDQEYILNQIIEQAIEHKIDSIFISGDIYDKSIPTIEGLKLFDNFLVRIIENNINVFIIAGNHDSPKRLEFAKELLTKHKIFISGEFKGSIPVISMKDDFGSINIHLLPFIKPSFCIGYYKEKVKTYEDAIKIILDNHEVNLNERNVLLAHQFVTWENNVITSDSETFNIGGVDKVDASLLFDFDYVALGHLHRSQKIGRDYIRYAGSPLPYSFSERNYKKSITKITLQEKGNVNIELIDLNPLKKMIQIKGELEELLKVARENGGSEEYTKAIITDDLKPYDVMGKLRNYYPNIMTIEFKSKNTIEDNTELTEELIKKAKTPIKLFEEFFKSRNNKELTEIQIDILNEMWENLNGDDED